MEHELFFEIGTEEIPAGFIQPALNSLREQLADRLAGLQLSFAGIRTVATPRRLAVCVSGLVDCQPDRQQEFLGPPGKAAFGPDNRPTRAALGFAASKGVAVEELQLVVTAKGEYVSVVKQIKGESTIKLLGELLPGLTLQLPFPKSMRWGGGRISFARPIHWLLALYGGKVVPFRIGGIATGRLTYGHRFMAPVALEINDFAHYLETLRANYVLVDPGERREAVIREIGRAAEAVSGQPRPDDELIDTVTNLVEYPFAVAGVFEERFLALPGSVLITSMREHQKYFCVVDDSGALRPNFIAVNNTRIEDSAMAAAGHQRVLRARLEDAFFFFNDDQTRTLADRVDDLAGLVFQARLGTMREKTGRLVQLAGILAGRLAPELVPAVERAALLAKADLLTAMVNEFPSLQGSMGRDYALLDNEEPRVAEAILDHYRPVRANGELPRDMVGALVGMADRLDSIVGCFGIGQIPSGTADPFGLRRQALGFIHIVEDRRFQLGLAGVVRAALELYGDKLTEPRETVRQNVLEFIKGRFVHSLISAGIPAAAVEAVVSVSFDDLVDCRSRIVALAAIRNEPTFAVLAAAFKRVMNIVKDNHGSEVRPELFQLPAEERLYRVFTEVAATVAPLLEEKKYQQALADIMRMKEPVDQFFDQVLVMAEEEELRCNRLNLLTGIARLFLRIGDFSKMQPAVGR
ncbi:MAG: glycine--tRNA ligase subunit beta [Desulfobacterales bacterium]|nr:glycine--tRNA ligase subunit beta [Desulfobacterales bacterium]